MNYRRGLVLGSWGLAVLIFAFALWGPRSVSPPGTVVPDPGERLDLGAVSRIFHADLQSRHSWILVLSDACEASLLVSEQLPDIRRAAALQQVRVVPLIVQVGGDPEPLIAMFEEHGLQEWGIGDRDSFRELRTWVVPTLIVLDVEGEVIATTNARLFSSSWTSLTPEAWYEASR